MHMHLSADDNLAPVQGALTILVAAAGAGAAQLNLLSFSVLLLCCYR